MEIFFKPSFIKDFKSLPLEIKEEVKKICLEIFPKLEDIRDLIGYQIKPIKGFKSYYRIRIKDYRLGFKKENHSIIFMRVKYRKDIYRYFP